MGWLRHAVTFAAAVALAVGLISCGDDTEPVRLATEGGYHPFNFINDVGEIDGLERELGDELCRRVELACEWVLNDWASMIPDLVAGEFDAIIAGMSITAERDETVEFTEPYYPPTPSVYLAAAGAGDEAVEGRLGAYADTIYSDYFTEQGIAYTELSSEDDRIEALLSGDIDASLVDHAYAVEKLGEYEGRLAIVGPSVLLDRGIGMGVRTNSDLLAKLNSALASMKADGSLDALVVKWVGEDAATFGGTSMSSPVPAPTATPAPVLASTTTPKPSPTPSPTPTFAPMPEPAPTSAPAPTVAPTPGPTPTSAATPTSELAPTGASASAYSMQPHVFLRVVLVTEEWVPFSSAGGWTGAAPQKESGTLRFYEAAIWEETGSVHLYAFPNDYDPLYGIFGDVAEDDVIAYREQFALSVHTGMPEESSDERSRFLRRAFEDFAAVLVERHPRAEHHFMFSGHGGPGGDLFAKQMKNTDAGAFLGSWRRLLGRPLGVIDMGGPCDKGGYEDLANFCKHARYYVASDLPNGGYDMDEWTPEKYAETDAETQYHRILAANDTLEEALIERINLRRKHYEYSRDNQTANKVAQANYLYSCLAFGDFSTAFEAFLDETTSPYHLYDLYDLYELMKAYSAPPGLLEKFQNVIVHAVDNRDFFEWNVPANGMISPLERIYQVVSIGQPTRRLQKRQ